MWIEKPDCTVSSPASGSSTKFSLHNEKTYSPLFNNTTNNFLVLLGLEVLGSLGGFDDDDAEAGALGVERSDSEVIHG